MAAEAAATAAGWPLSVEFRRPAFDPAFEPALDPVFEPAFPARLCSTLFLLAARAVKMREGEKPDPVIAIAPAPPADTQQKTAQTIAKRRIPVPPA